MTTKFYLMYKYLVYIMLTIIIVSCVQEPICNPLSSVVAEYEYVYNGEPKEGLCMGSATLVDSTSSSYTLEGNCFHNTYEANFKLELYAIDSYYEGIGTLEMFGQETEIIAWAFKQTEEAEDTFLTIKLEAQMDIYDIYINGLVLIQLEE